MKFILKFLSLILMATSKYCLKVPIKFEYETEGFFFGTSKQTIDCLVEVTANPDIFYLSAIEFEVHVSGLFGLISENKRRNVTYKLSENGNLQFDLKYKNRNDACYKPYTICHIEKDEIDFTKDVTYENETYKFGFLRGQSWTGTCKNSQAESPISFNFTLRKATKNDYTGSRNLLSEFNTSDDSSKSERTQILV